LDNRISKTVESADCHRPNQSDSDPSRKQGFENANDLNGTLKTPVTIGSLFGEWRVCWLGGWTRPAMGMKKLDRRLRWLETVSAQKRAQGPTPVELLREPIRRRCIAEGSEPPIFFEDLWFVKMASHSHRLRQPCGKRGFIDESL
jgi:hypothetical protein